MDEQSNITRLLIIEDDADIRALLHHYLKDMVDEIVEASDGSEALQYIKETEFDAILSDIEMPNMNGLKLLAYVRSLGKLTPFIVLTAHGDFEKALEAMSLGAYDFITKNAKRKEMLEAVASAVKLGKAMNAAKNDPELSSQLKRIYSEVVKYSEYRLRKIIDEMKMTS